MPQIILSNETNMDLFKSKFVVILSGDSHVIDNYDKNFELNRFRVEIQKMAKSFCVTKLANN
jgi:hypothetical protein